MAPSLPEFTLGVEEEYQIIDPVTRELSPQGDKILAEAQKTLGKDIQPEVYLSQIEIATPVCHTLADVRAALLHLRGQVIAAAATANSQIAAAGTHPFSNWAEQSVTPVERYQGLVRDYQQIMRELIIFGCHVHVGVSDREIAIQIMNRARLWLAPMLALTANSPFWLGEDSGYSSFRTLLWSRWATAGPPSFFASRSEYDALVDALIAARAVRDGTKLYWDIRPSERFETLEFRVMDVCATVDEAVMVAGITRALVQTCYEQIIEGNPFTDVRPELLRAAQWRAARFGLNSNLIDVVNQQSIPAQVLIETLLTFIKPALKMQGDWDEVSTIVYRLLQEGNGATRQRAVYQQTGQLEAVVDYLVAETAKGTA